MRRLRFLFVLIVLLVSFCSEEVLPEPNIYAVISSDSSHALVLVGELLEPGDTFSVDTVSIDTVWVRDTFYISVIRAPLWNGVKGAEVELKRGEEAFALEEMQDSAGYYYSNSLMFAAGESWELEVDYPDGRFIEARTQIPGSFEIISPLTDTFHFEDTLRWSESKGAKGYELRFFCWWSVENEDSIEYYSGEARAGLYHADSLRLFAGKHFDGNDSVEIFVVAYNLNLYDYVVFYKKYYDYVSNLEDYMHIEGAWGVFGAQTVVSRRYYLPAPDTTYPPAVDKD
jgi:hypothetical protein